MKNKLNYDVLIKPIITEKSMKLVSEKNQYMFMVSSFADKVEIGKVVAEKFKVKVLKVRIINIRGKSVAWGRNRIKGKRSRTKKAIVTLKSSDSIDLFKVK